MRLVQMLSSDLGVARGSWIFSLRKEEALHDGKEV